MYSIRHGTEINKECLMPTNWNAFFSTFPCFQQDIRKSKSNSNKNFAKALITNKKINKYVLLFSDMKIERTLGEREKDGKQIAFDLLVFLLKWKYWCDKCSCPDFQTENCTKIGQHIMTIQLLHRNDTALSFILSLPALCTVTVTNN